MSLRGTLDWPLPAIPPGSRTAVFCAGTCADSERRLAGLKVVVDGTAHPATFGMPPDGRYWATVSVAAPPRPGHIPLSLTAELDGGLSETLDVGEIEVVAEPEPAPIDARPARGGAGLIVVCMATFEPAASLFEAQLESLRSQTDQHWVCVISDDCSSPEHYERIRAAVAGDPRFVISRSERRLGFYRNFERALSLVPVEAELVALSDQDDRWHPEKLGTLRRHIAGSVLAYSDQRLVEADGTLRRTTLWEGRRNNHTNLASMLVANTITGAAAIFRRELLELALPFPETPGFQFHDHWLAVIALAAGEVAYCAEPLYEYVQHSGAVFGDVTHGGGAEGLGARIRARYTPASWRAAYFYGYLARKMLAQTALDRCADRLTPRKRRALELFIDCDTSLGALAWLVGRSARALTGRTETLGTELELAQGLAWRRAVGVAARHRPLPRGMLSDATIPSPDRFTQKRLRRWRARV